MQPDWLKEMLSGPADPDVMTKTFPWAARMIGCPHDAVYHAEGDPWTHTIMVAEALEAIDGFQELSNDHQDILRLSAWFHDVAKPHTTEVGWDEDQQRVRVRQPNHAMKGAMMAWTGLLDAGCSAELARDVFNMVFWHQRPSHLLDQSSAPHKIIQFSVDAGRNNWANLMRFCQADQLGRISTNSEKTLQDIELTRLLVGETGLNIGVDLLTEAWPFHSPEARLKYLRGTGPELPFYEPVAAAGSRVVMMSGLPGSGKDTFLRRNFPGLPAVSLDDIRDEMGVSATDDQGRVHQEAFNRIRGFLRRHENFAVNATALTRVMRQKLTGTVLDYDGRIEAYSIDVPLSVARSRNAGRAEPVPDNVIVKLGQKREPILSTEAHALYSVDEDMQVRMVFGGEGALERDLEPAAW